VSQQSHKNYKLIPSSGIDNICIGVSNSKDIVRYIGQTKIKRKWRSNTYPLLLGEIIHEIKYPNLGLTFIVSGYKGRFSKKTLKYIIIDSTSNIKTSNGIGVGSSYFEIINEFGVTKFSHGPSSCTDMSYDMSYTTIEGKEQSLSIRFWQDKITDTLNFKVSKIVLHRW
jgi:hypothetical protein